MSQTTSTSSQTTSTSVVKVEETWRVEVGEPNVRRSGPQVTMAMSPTECTTCEFFVFTLNHKNSPSYDAGGMQVNLFNGPHLTGYRNGAKDGTLHRSEEIVEWKQRLTLNDNGTVTFDVVDGNSESWGTFGGQGYLRATTQGTYDNLNAYLPKTSLSESEVGFAGNRVSYLKLMKVRWHLADGRVFELNAPIDVDSDLNPWD